ncbi:Uncharacterised protein [Klebsiella pneumoniae subsp. ozaenae]|uniref:Uncharacterized protein n=1 Tax=Klebsiella pneumoniae subsp. ozaenae TaxID=574 RepID=A0A378B4J0_KLEPO|nr:Uncharacterised protein [Klebsiella pneumoniae subsp. ozaenae]
MGTAKTNAVMPKRHTTYRKKTPTATPAREIKPARFPWQIEREGEIHHVGAWGLTPTPAPPPAKAINEANSGITYLQLSVMPRRAATSTMLPDSILSSAPVTWCLSISLFCVRQQPPYRTFVTLAQRTGLILFSRKIVISQTISIPSPSLTRIVSCAASLRLMVTNEVNLNLQADTVPPGGCLTLH